MHDDLLRGHLDSLILAVVEAEPLHGYAIMESLRSRSGGMVDVPAGTIYPALRRLEEAGALSSKWGEVDGRRRRTYRLTRSGRRRLETERTDWTEFSSVLDRLLRPGGT